MVVEPRSLVEAVDEVELQKHPPIDGDVGIDFRDHDDVTETTHTGRV